MLNLKQGFAHGFISGAFVFIALFSLIVSSTCSVQPASVARKDYKKSWTVLVYMAADNDLETSAPPNIKEMELAGSGSNLDILVYLARMSDSTPSYPVLMHIQKNLSSNIVSPIIKSYPVQDSCAASNIQSVLQYVFTEYPATNTGVIFWSHGSGWIPKTFSPLSFGVDDSANGDQTDIPDLNNALAGLRFSFIAFDACYMADVETAYELRSRANYMMASQTEILTTGFPYDKIFGYIGSNWNAPVKSVLDFSAQAYYQYYQTQAEDYLQSASISVIDLSQMESLASAFSNFMASAAAQAGYSSLVNIGNSVQSLSLLPAYSNVKFDMGDWINCIYGSVSNTPEYSRITNTYDQAVVYSAHTSLFMDTLSLSNVSGLSI
jgi:hypothetical protein